MNAPISLPVPRLLVVEDNYLMAQVICDFIRDCGMEPVGPACDLEAGLELARQGNIVGAVLDINLNGRASFPICALLLRRGVPFLFLTGYSVHTARDLIPADFRLAAHIEKPFVAEQFRDELQHLVDASRELSGVAPADALAGEARILLGPVAGSC